MIQKIWALCCCVQFTTKLQIEQTPCSVCELKKHPCKWMQKLIVWLSNQYNQSNLIEDHLSNYSDIGNRSLKLLLIAKNNSIRTDTLSSIHLFQYLQFLTYTTYYFIFVCPQFCVSSKYTMYIMFYLWWILVLFDISLISLK